MKWEDVYQTGVTVEVFQLQVGNGIINLVGVDIKSHLGSQTSAVGDLH